MRYAKRNKHKLNRVYKITYLGLSGLHYEYAKTESKETAKKYADKEAYNYGAVVVDIKLSSLPKNLNNDENFVDLI